MANSYKEARKRERVAASEAERAAELSDQADVARGIAAAILALINTPPAGAEGGRDG